MKIGKEIEEEEYNPMEEDEGHGNMQGCEYRAHNPCHD